MAVNSRPQVVLNEVTTQTTTSDWTNDTVLVTWTATMSNGSLLIADNTEAAEAAAATVVKVINDPTVEAAGYEVGDTVSVNVAVQGCVFNTAALSYSDTNTVTASALTALAAQLNTFK